ncbi:hypothetical protein [Pseudoduganella sp. HUAS MS19]
MEIAYISLATTVAVAFVGYLATYTNNLLLARRRERLDLVSRQLNEFYGPLYLSTRASAIAYSAMTAKLGATFRQGFPLSSTDGDTPAMREWRLWVLEVLMPMNATQEKLILNSAHLIREHEVPDCLLQLIAHIAAWKAVIKKWNEGNIAEQFALIPYPAKVSEYAAEAFRSLKAEQLALIGKTT